jgi:NitT/TauT family transport system permease protein
MWGGRPARHALGAASSAGRPAASPIGLLAAAGPFEASHGLPVRVGAGRMRGVIVAGRRVPAVFSLGIWLLVWEAVGRARLSIIVPPLSSVLAAAPTVLATETFGRAAFVSLRAFAAGMAAALLVGLPAGVVMARVAGAGRLLGTWVNVFVSAPVSALVPILMAVVGIGDTTVVVTVFLFAVFVIALDVQVGVTRADRSLVEMARAFGARPYQVYTKVLLLSALPEILTGVRLGAIRGVKGVVIGQLLVALIGIGELFELYSKHFLMEEFWLLVVVVFAFAFAVSEAIGALERRVEYYARAR